MIREIRTRLFAAVILSTTLWACGGDTAATPTKSLQAVADALIADLTANGGAAQVIGSEGGTVEDAASGAAIEVPAGALPEPASGDAYVVSVVPRASDVKAPSGFAIAGDQFDISIRTVLDQTNVQPVAPVKITLPYDKSVDKADTALLAVGNYHEGKWVTEATEKVDTAALKVTASFETLSPFGALLSTPGNQAPVADDQSISTDEDATIAGTATASDADGDKLTYALADGGDVQHGMLALASNGAFTYTPAANYNGSDRFIFEVSDGALTSNSAIVTITVNPVNDAPTVNALTLTTKVDAILLATLTGSDVEGSSLTYSVVTAPTHGTAAVTAATGALVYTPTADYAGSDVFYVRSYDGAAYSKATAVNVTVKGATRYVRPSAVGTADGKSWANATSDLQAAVNAVYAAGGGEVWLAKGTYRASGTGTFLTMAADVNLYGGFAATETTLAQRGAVDAAATVLSGDTDASGTATTGDAYHVVRGAGAKLDGLTITGGNANQIGSDGQGAGIYHSSAGTPLTLVNVRVSGNHANSDGGGVYTTANVVFRNARLEKNTANNSAAGLFAYYGNVTMENVAVVGNVGGGSASGGGLYIMYSSLDFRNGVVSGNSSNFSGGGIYFTAATATLFNVVVSNNSANPWHGGGIFDSSGTVLKLINVDVVNNSAVGNGGGMYVSSSPSLTVRNSTFWGNTAGNSKDIYFPPSSSIFNTCAETNFSSYGTGTSTATTNPFVTRAASGEYFFDPAHGCANWGNATTASTYFTPTGTTWENWTSEIAGTVVEGSTTGVAAGTLFHPQDVWIRTLSATASTIDWLTNDSAASCRVTNNADSNVVTLGASDLPSGSVGHALASGTIVTLTCDSPRSYPKEATTTVP